MEMEQVSCLLRKRRKVPSCVLLRTGSVKKEETFQKVSGNQAEEKDRIKDTRKNEG